jgi:hypothetical protein
VETFMNNVVKEAPPPAAERTDGRIAYGLKEALQESADRAAARAGRPDGYYGDPAIRIAMPERLQAAEKGVRAAGMAGMADDFVRAMSRAAERSAPEARLILLEAIRGIGFDEPRRILLGGDTAASDYFRARAADRLRASLLPIVRRNIDEAGTQRDFEAFEARAEAVAAPPADSFDLDAYVAGKALDGLFRLMGDQEREIRRNPAARDTALLREVFAR